MKELSHERRNELTATLDPPRTSEHLEARPSKGSHLWGGRVFAGLSYGSGILILLVLAAVAVFLVIEAWPALSGKGGGPATESQ